FHQGLGRDENGRPTLRFAHTWCYLEVEDTLYRVKRAWCEEAGGRLVSCRLLLDDASEELLSDLALGDDGVLYARVKEGGEWARFSPEAQAALGPYLEPEGTGFVLVTSGGQTPVTAFRSGRA